MWIDSAFHPDLIDKELGTASGLGYNFVCVFLSFAVWDSEGAVFEKSFDTYLKLADKHALSVMPVIFDNYAFDFGSEPVCRPQPEPASVVWQHDIIRADGTPYDEEKMKFIRCYRDLAKT